MRRVQVFPRSTFSLFGAMVAKEAALARKQRGTFRRRGRTGKRRAEWRHLRFRGSVRLRRAAGEMLEMSVRGKKGEEWQLLRAILGFIDRHFAPRVRAIHIQYGE